MMNHWSWGGNRYSLEAGGGATTDAYPGEWWSWQSEESIGGGGSLIRDQGRCGINLSYDHPDRGGAVYSGRGGYKKGSRRKW